MLFFSKYVYQPEKEYCFFVLPLFYREAVVKILLIINILIFLMEMTSQCIF